ncbi:pyocin activator PrtN family protein [Stutzerimonas balearica]|uniref:pyocin activator PrtN family protein n=1 Tax=Stutzerimonas balearica TaxID=74829 RepID=UPI0028A63DD7|nr:pyocin activator PrtN family protein [Stutzerimonas balearica]
MKTLFILMAQYDGLAVVPLERVCADYFPHLLPEKLLRKVLAGQLRLPITRIEPSQKAARGVHIQDLADYIDARRDEALKGLEKLHHR